jgi:hydroxymethylbilane synthase
LALVQAGFVRRKLAHAHGLSEADIEIVVIRTSGDAIQDRALAEAGGKGLFTKELDSALIEGRIELAVHSAKDLPTQLPEAIVIAGYPAREDPRDVLIARGAASLADLPQGALVGSASLRREALVRRLRPDLRVVLLRGNVETRLRKVEAGEIDATLLALAGLERLGHAEKASVILEPEVFTPAVGQGALAVTIRAGDGATQTLLAPILDADTAAALACERAFLHVLDGSCRTPIAGYARIGDGTVQFRGVVLKRDGSQAHEVVASAPVTDAAACGAAAGRDLLARLPAGFLGS